MQVKIAVDLGEQAVRRTAQYITLMLLAARFAVACSSSLPPAWRIIDSRNIMPLSTLTVLLIAAAFGVDALRRLNGGVPAPLALHPRAGGTVCKSPKCHNPDDYRAQNEDWNNFAAHYINERYFYFADITLRDQDLRLLLDTGSGSMWINDQRSSVSCDCPKVRGALLDQNSLFIYQSLDLRSEGVGTYKARYVDKTAVDGKSVSSTIRIYDQSENGRNDDIRDVVDVNQTFGIATYSDQCMGILGIGYLADDEEDNMSLIKNLRAQHITESETYSLYHPLEATGGSILFGAYDAEKFHEPLERIPLVYESYEQTQPTVNISQIATHIETEPHDGGLDLATSFSAVLDTGAVLTYLPPELVRRLIERYEDEDVNLYQKYQGEELYAVDCSWQRSQRYINFTLSSVTIQIPSRNLILPVPINGDSNRCVFGVASNIHSQNESVLGYTFFTSVYAIFDLERSEVFLAQANANSTGSEIRNITADGVLGSRPRNSNEGEPTSIEDTTTTIDAWPVPVLRGLKYMIALLVDM